MPQFVGAPNVQVGKTFAMANLTKCFIHIHAFFSLPEVPTSSLSPITTEPTTTTTTTTPTQKILPCIIQQSSKEKSEDKTQEKSQESKKESTKKPKSISKLNRRRRSAKCVSTGNKRCIGHLFGKPFSFDSILGAANPNAAAASTEIDRYESKNKIAPSVKVQSKRSDDNAVEESILQAIPITNHRQLNSLGVKPKLLNLLSKKSLSTKNENLLHGNIAFSSEKQSSESSKATESESNQSDLDVIHHYQKTFPIQPMMQPADQPRYLTPNYQPDDYLPSYEYFPKNSQSFNSPPIHQNHPISDDPESKQQLVVGPSSFKSTSLFDLDLQAKNAEISSFRDSNSDLSSSLSSPSSVAIHQSSSCHCDPEQFNDLLHHMQSSYQQFHNGMIQLFETFKSQSNCASNLPSMINVNSDSTSSHSQTNFDYKTRCTDRNSVNSNPALASMCVNAFPDARINPSTGYYEPPGQNIKTGGFENQFISYADYLEMMRNVNANSGTVLSSAHELDEPVVASSQNNNESRDQTLNQLRQHIDQFKDVEVAAPEPTTEDPKTTAKFDMKSLLGNWGRKN